MANSTYTLEYLIGAKTAGSYYANINRASKSITGMEGTAKRAARLIGTAFAAINLKNLAVDAVETYGTFEKSMANTAGIADATKAQYKQLENAARSAGRATTKTAAESADALGYMSLAGWNVNDSVKGLMPVLRLAEATQADLKTTSDLVTDSMSATGMSVDDLNTYLDKLVKLNNKANTTSGQAMEALIKTGGAARVLGVDFDDLATATGILANTGRKGTEAGTTLNAIISRFGANKTAQKAMRNLNVEMYDGNKQFIGFEELLKRIQKAMSGLSTEEQAGYLKDLAGTHYYSQLKYLLDGVATSGKNSVSNWDQLKGAIRDSTGALNTMNKTATHTLSASGERFKSAMDDMKIGSVEVFSGSAMEAVDSMALKIPEITDAIEKWGNENSYSIVEAVDGAGDALESATEGALNFGSAMVDNRGILKGVLATVISIKTATFALEKGEAFTKMLAGITPIGKEVALIGLAIGGVVGAVEQIKAHNEDLINQNMEQHFGNVVLSLEEIKEAADQVVGIDTRDALNAIDDQNAALKQTEDSLKTVREELGKANWKAEVGIELDKTDIDSYKTNAQSLVEQTQQWLENKQYAVNMQIKLLMGGTDNDVSRSTNDYYAEQKRKLAKLGKDLQKAVNDAFEDGFLDFDEEKKLSNLEQQIANMQNKLSNAKYQAALDTAAVQYEGQDLSPSSFKNLEKQISKTTDKTIEGYKKAYQTGMTSLYAQLEDGSITRSDFASQKQELYKAYLDQSTKTQTNSASFLAEQIESHYKDDIAKGTKEAKKNIAKQIKDYMTDDSTKAAYGSGENLLMDIRDSLIPNAISGDTSGAIRKLLEQLEPREKEMKALRDKYRQEGLKIPKELSDGLRDIQVLKELTNSSEVSWQTVAEAMKDSPYASQLLSYMKQKGMEIPKELSDAINANKNGVHPGINSVWQESNSYAKSKFSSGISVTVPFKVTPKVELRKKIKALSLTNMLIQGNNPNVNIDPGKIYQNAVGGIYNSPILTTFAEKGPEAAIPLDGTQRARRLWLEAGARMGMGRDARAVNAMQSHGSAGGNISIAFSPTVTITGSATSEDVHRGLQMSYKDLQNMLDEYSRQRQRRSFKR